MNERLKEFLYRGKEAFVNNVRKSFKKINNLLEIQIGKCKKRQDLIIISGLVSSMLVFGMYFYRTVSIENVHFRVFEFFDAIESNDITKLECIFEGSGAQEINKINDSFASMSIEEEYGTKFCENINEFKKYFLRKVYSKIEIIQTECTNGIYSVKVKGRSKSNFVYDNSNLEVLVNEYEKAHQSELAKINKIEGRNKMIQKIYTDLADTILSDMKKQFNEWEDSEFISVFTVEEKKGNLIITDITTSNK